MTPQERTQEKVAGVRKASRYLQMCLKVAASPRRFTLEQMVDAAETVLLQADIRLRLRPTERADPFPNKSFSPPTPLPYHQVPLLTTLQTGYVLWHHRCSPREVVVFMVEATPLGPETAVGGSAEGHAYVLVGADAPLGEFYRALGQALLGLSPDQAEPISPSENDEDVPVLSEEAVARLRGCPLLTDPETENAAAIALAA